mgnify:CR=1 FL=1
MARAMNCSIFVANGSNFNGLGQGGEGFTSFSIASPTGEGLTRPRTFSRTFGPGVSLHRSLQVALNAFFGFVQSSVRYIIQDYTIAGSRSHLSYSSTHCACTNYRNFPDRINILHPFSKIKDKRRKQNIIFVLLLARFLWIGDLLTDSCKTDF